MLVYVGELDRKEVDKVWDRREVNILSDWRVETSSQGKFVTLSKHSTELHRTETHCTAPHRTAALRCAVLHCTALHQTTQHSTAFLGLKRLPCVFSGSCGECEGAVRLYRSSSRTRQSRVSHKDVQSVIMD